MVNSKKGFTIAEMLVCVLIMSILVSLTIKVFTRRHQKPMFNPVHGYFVCYRDVSTGRIYQKTSSQSPIATNGSCSFRPIKHANYYVVYAIGGGGGGGSSYGGSQGSFTTMFLTSIADSLTVVPGVGGARNTDGGDTYVKNPDGDILLYNEGGLSGRRNAIDDSKVLSCEAYPLPKVLDQVTFKKDATDLPKCSITSSGITASVCAEKIEDTNQDSYINNFFNNYDDARKSVYNDYSINGYDGKWVYDASANRLYYWQNPRKIQSSSYDRYYDGNSNALYAYSPSTSSWYYYGSSPTSNAPQCVTETLDYSNITLTSSDAGLYITRASASSNPLFKIIIKLRKNLDTTNLSSGVSSSEFVEYVKNSGLLTNDVSFLNNAGKGGSSNRSGYAGAVMISW